MPRGQNREKILAAGLRLFYQRGYHGAGIGEITAAAGVPKGSFYNYFQSKEDFAGEVLSHYTELACQYLDTSLSKQSLTPLNRLKELFERFAQDHSQQNLGCLTGNLTQEMASQSDNLRRLVDQSLKTMEERYRQCLSAAQQAGELDLALDTHATAYFLYNSWQGTLLRAKAEGNNQAIKRFTQSLFTQLLV